MANAWRNGCRTIMQVAPLLPVAAGLIAGIVVDAQWNADRWVYAGLFLSLSVLTVIRRVRDLAGPLLVVAAAGCLGGILHLRAARVVPPLSIARHVDEDARIARIRGVVLSEPRILDPPSHEFARWSYGSERTVFLVETQTIEGMAGDVPVAGRIRVTVHEPVLDLRGGERVELFGWLYRPGPPRNPGSFDWAGFYGRQGIVAAMRCQHRENVRPLDPDVPLRCQDIVLWLRTKVRAMLTDDLATGADEELTLLEAMVLGHRSRLDRRLDEVFVQAGVIHFLAVSGTNVVMLSSFVWLLGRLVGRSRRQCAWLIIGTVVAYALIAEPRPPILRATVIALLFCMSLLLRRTSAPLNWLSAAAVVLLVWDPNSLFDVGFQLSFAAVLGVSYGPRPIIKAAQALGRFVERVVLHRPFAEQDRALIRHDPRSRSGLWWRMGRLVRTGLVVSLAVSLAAWLAGMPIAAWHFNRIQPWSAMSSVIVFPLVYIVMILGLVKIVLGGICAPLGGLVGKLLIPFDQILIWAVEGLSSLPGTSLVVAAPPWWVIAAYYVFLVLFVLAFRTQPQERPGPSPAIDRRARAALRWLRAAGATAFLLLLTCGGVWYGSRHGPDRLTITILSVGDGLATVIELPDGGTMLYDVGTVGPYDIGRNTLVPFLRHRGISRIDCVHLSHPNLDHFSGLPSVLDAIETGPLVVNEWFSQHGGPRSPSQHLLDLLAKRRHPVETLDPTSPPWQRAGVTFELLSPRADFEDAAVLESSTVTANDTSTVLRLTYAGRSVLLTGDIGEYGRRHLLEHGGLHADVLVLPHHGSVRPSSEAFLAAVGAGVLVRSGGERTAETDSGLSVLAGDTPLYDTAEVGAVRMVIDKTGVTLTTARTEAP